MGLAYASEAEDLNSRCHRKWRKLAAKLGPDGGKPKGMHWRTYERICAQIEGVDAELNRLCIAAVAPVLAGPVRLTACR